MKVFTITLPSQAQIFAEKRRVNSIDGTLKGTTKVQGRKGKKAYNRKDRNWQKEH